METVYIYTLEHPITKEIRYVGKTKNPKMRFHNHCNKLHNEKSHKRNWINKLKKEGLKPKMKILDEVLESEWKFWERFWINQLKQWNFNLVNHTSGGDGLTLGNETSFKKGNIPWNYGTAKPKVLKGNRGRTENSVKNNFQKGFIPWNKNSSGYTTSKEKKVYQYCAYTGEFIKEWFSSKKAGETLNINSTGIRNCCLLINKSAGGYIWKYFKQEKIEIMNNVKLKIKKIC